MNDVLEYRSYHTEVHFSFEDEIFHGKILDIKDLVSFQGRSIKDLKKSFREAVDDYIDVLIEIEKYPEKGTRNFFN